MKPNIQMSVSLINFEHLIVEPERATERDTHRETETERERERERERRGRGRGPCSFRR